MHPSTPQGRPPNRKHLSVIRCLYLFRAGATLPRGAIVDSPSSLRCARHQRVDGVDTYTPSRVERNSNNACRSRL